MASAGGKRLVGEGDKHQKQELYMKQYEEWRKSRVLKQALSDSNQTKKSAAETLKVKSGGVIKRQNTFCNTRRSPRLKENVAKIPAVKRSHSLSVKPDQKDWLAIRNKVLAEKGRNQQNEQKQRYNQGPQQAGAKTPLNPKSESGASRKQLLEDWKRKKEEEKQQQLQARPQAVKTPHKGRPNFLSRTPGTRDGRPPFIVENANQAKTKFESAKEAGLLNDRRQTLENERRLTLGSGLDRRKSYAESLRLSAGKKPTGPALKRSQSVISKPAGPCRSLIQRKKEENRQKSVSSSNIHRSNSCVGPSSSAAAALQRRKSYGQGLRAAVEQKTTKLEKGKRTSLSALHRMNKPQTQQTVKPTIVHKQIVVEESFGGSTLPEYTNDKQDAMKYRRRDTLIPKELLRGVDDSKTNTENFEYCSEKVEVISDNLMDTPKQNNRRETFSPKEIQTPVDELKAVTGPGRRRSTPQQDTPKSKAQSYKSRKSILKSEQLPKTPGIADRKVQFHTPSSVTLRRAKQSTPSWTPKKDMSMREKLDAWLVSKGKTPTRFRHLHCFDEHLNGKCDDKVGKKVDAGLTSDELRHQQEMLDVEAGEKMALNVQLGEVLAECKDLVDMGCPGETLLFYLDKIEECLPSSKQSSAYWICRARVAEEEDLEEVAVDMYESAVVHGAQPPRDIVEALKGFVMRMEERKRAKREASITPWKHHNEDGMDANNIFESSSIKYCVSKSTPLMKRLDSTGRKKKGTPKAVITPVRRSTRLSHSSLPSILQDHDEIVDNLESLTADSQASALFKPNRALEQDFEEAMNDED